MIDPETHLTEAIIDSVRDPIQALACAVVFSAIKDAKIDLTAIQRQNVLRERARQKLEAIDFILSQDFEVWIMACLLKFEPAYLRKMVQCHLDKRNEVAGSIKYKEFRKKFTKKAITSLDIEEKPDIIPS